MEQAIIPIWAHEESLLDAGRLLRHNAVTFYLRSNAVSFCWGIMLSCFQSLSLSRFRSGGDAPFSFDILLRRALKVSEQELGLYAHELAIALLHRSAHFLSKIVAKDVLSYKEDVEEDDQEITFHEIMREAQKISEIINYDLLFLPSNRAHRQRIARFYLETLNSSWNQHDFHTTMLIYNALSHPDITRIPYCKQELATLESFDELLGPSGGFSNLCKRLEFLREERKKASQEGEKMSQVIPYFGSYIHKILRIKATPYERNTIIDEKLQKIFEEIEDYKTLISFDSNLLLSDAFLARKRAQKSRQNYEKSKALQARAETCRRATKAFLPCYNKIRVDVSGLLAEESLLSRGELTQRRAVPR